MLLQAHILDAAVKLSDSKGGAEVSAIEVHEFMLERARQYPLCMLVLLETRLATIAKMMQNAEQIGECGSVELLFLTAVRFAMRLFAMTHKVDYMRLMFLIYIMFIAIIAHVVYMMIVYSSESWHSPTDNVVARIINDLCHSLSDGCPSPGPLHFVPVSIELLFAVDFSNVWWSAANVGQHVIDIFAPFLSLLHVPEGIIQ